MPDRIVNAPDLLPGLGLFYIAFMDLTSERQVGQMLGAIPWSAIDRYCEANEFNGEQREDVFYHVSRLDKVYLEWYADRQKKELAAIEAKNKAAQSSRKQAPRRR